jgi:hypothetical protein
MTNYPKTTRSQRRYADLKMVKLPGPLGCGLNTLKFYSTEQKRRMPPTETARAGINFATPYNTFLKQEWFHRK